MTEGQRATQKPFHSSRPSLCPLFFLKSPWVPLVLGKTQASAKTVSERQGGGTVAVEVGQYMVTYACVWPPGRWGIKQKIGMVSAQCPLCS